MSEFRERVAWAMFECHYDRPPSERSVENTWEGALPVVRKWRLREADAAIKAMREPLLEMSRAGAKVNLTCCYGHEDEDATKVWTAMIDVAVAEKER